MNVIEQFIAQAQRGGCTVALCEQTLARFKGVSGTSGYLTTLIT
jgi:hypothetical protein